MKIPYLYVLVKFRFSFNTNLVFGWNSQRNKSLTNMIDSSKWWTELMFGSVLSSFDIDRWGWLDNTLSLRAIHQLFPLFLLRVYGVHGYCGFIAIFRERDLWLLSILGCSSYLSNCLWVWMQSNHLKWLIYAIKIN